MRVEVGMTTGEIQAGFGVVMLALATLVAALTERGVWRRAQTGKPPRWGRVVAGGLLTLVLAAPGLQAFLALPRPFANRPAPASADTTIVFHAQQLQGSDNVLEGVSARDGSLRWTRTLPSPIDSVIAGPPGLVVATSITSPQTLYAVRTSDGAVLWSQTKRIQPMLGGPTSDGFVMDHAGLYGLMGTGSGTATIVALSLQDGAPRWQDPYRESNLSALAVDRGTLFVASDDLTGTGWTVTALRTSDGAQLWSVTSSQLGEQPLTNPQPLVTAADGLVFVAGRTGNVKALDEQSGALVWAIGQGALPVPPLTILTEQASGGTLYLTAQLEQQEPGSGGSQASSSYERLYALNAHMGGIRWHATVNIRPELVSTTGDTVLVSQSDGSVETFDAASGALLWNSAPTLPSYTPWRIVTHEYAPFIVGNVVFVDHAEPDPSANLLSCGLACPDIAWLYAADPRTGALWWRVREGTVQSFHFTL
jgi:outer membrane protein assembly factor BamB